MLLPYSDGLMPSNRGDSECAELADRHYSRRTVGSKQFTGPGSDLVLRDSAGSVVFVWIWHNESGQQLERWDRQAGYCCSLFRNESRRRASDIIREAETIVVATWGPNRFYTYVDPAKVPPTMFRGYPVWGWCFYKAGWSFVKVTKDGKHLLEKGSQPGAGDDASRKAAKRMFVRGPSPIYCETCGLLVPGHASGAADVCGCLTPPGAASPERT